MRPVRRGRTIAERHQNGRDAGGSRRVDIHGAVTHHDGSRRIATGRGDDTQEVAGVRLRDLEGVALGNRGKVVVYSQGSQKQIGQAFSLVGADRKFRTGALSRSRAATAPGKGRLSTAMFAS